MARIDWVSVFNSSRKDKTIAVMVKLKPAGEVRLEVPIPEKFFDVLMKIVQTAADNHEALMHAEILGERNET